MKILPNLAAIGVAILISGCAQSGSMVVVGSDPTTGRSQRADYSKYFDGADWLVPDTLGVSVVVDNDTPISQQVFGGFTGKDSDAVGTVTVYFWNLGTEHRKASLIRFQHEQAVLEHKADFAIGPGPFTRTKHAAGTIPFFAYATDLKTSLVIEIDGVEIRRDVVAVRRTFAELKKYWGPDGTPPYPWFDPKYKQPNKAPEPTPMAVTPRAPSSTSRASHRRGSS